MDIHLTPLKKAVKRRPNSHPSPFSPRKGLACQLPGPQRITRQQLKRCHTRPKQAAWAMWAKAGPRGLVGCGQGLLQATKGVAHGAH
jgi:hypothetical protein